MVANWIAGPLDAKNRLASAVPGLWRIPRRTVTGRCHRDPTNSARQGTIELIGNNLRLMPPHPTHYPGVVLPQSSPLRLAPCKNSSCDCMSGNGNSGSHNAWGDRIRALRNVPTGPPYSLGVRPRRCYMGINSPPAGRRHPLGDRLCRLAHHRAASSRPSTISLCPCTSGGSSPPKSPSRSSWRSHPRHRLHRFPARRPLHPPRQHPRHAPGRAPRPHHLRRPRLLRPPRTRAGPGHRPPRHDPADGPALPADPDHADLDRIQLVWYSPWLLLLLVVGVAAFLLRRNSLRLPRLREELPPDPHQAHHGLPAQVGGSKEAAKELKLFNLSDYLTHRFTTLSEQIYGENVALSRKKLLVGRSALAPRHLRLLRRLRLRHLAKLSTAATPSASFS